MKFYEINQALEDILNRFVLADDQLIDSETGEVLEEDEAAAVFADLDALQMERGEKLENLACWVKGMDADIVAMKTEEKNLAARRRSLENKRERIFNFLQYNLDGQKITSPRVKVSYRRTQTVNITDLSAIPGSYIRVKTIEEPDKVAIKDAYKAGEQIPGTELVERLSMSIK